MIQLKKSAVPKGLSKREIILMKPFRKSIKCGLAHSSTIIKENKQNKKKEKTMINFNVNKKDMFLIIEISKKAKTLFDKTKVSCSLLDINMDITATHTSNPLKLQELLKADSFNFAHDIFGIYKNLNRRTGNLDNCFLPRYSV